ncbi:MAG: transposase, partial [Acidimicrobiales bacterium]
RIEAACRSDLAFRAICVQLVPADVTIARFRADHETAIKEVFTGVLRLCAQAGLASLGTVAIDGTKIGSDAALDANHSEQTIRAEVDRIMAEAASADDTEPSLPTLAGELPADLARPGTRRARLEAALAEIAAQRAVADAAAAKAQAEAQAGRRLPGRSVSDPHAAVGRAEADVAASKVKATAARGPKARQQAQEKLAAAEKTAATARRAAEVARPTEVKANTTDPTSRIRKTATGWVQGFNTQAAVNDNQVVIAHDITQDHNDADQLVPMMDAVATTAQAAGIEEGVGTVLADAGYWSEANATADGPDRLIATTKDWKQRRAARDLGTTHGDPPEGASALEAMEHRLRTPEGAALYARRSCTVEPVFGQAKENRGIRRFMRRGLTAAQSEWSLVCATANIAKLFTHADGRPLRAVLSSL